MKAMTRLVNDHDKIYECLMFVCPGCKEFGGSGLHMIPVNNSIKEPSWNWDGNLLLPTLEPSILTGKDTKNICHSYLRVGEFEYLGDCTHSLVGQHVPMPDLPDWVIDEG